MPVNIANENSMSVTVSPFSYGINKIKYLRIKIYTYARV